MGSLNLLGLIFENSEEDIRYLAKKIKEFGVQLKAVEALLER